MSKDDPVFLANHIAKKNGVVLGVVPPEQASTVLPTFGEQLFD